MNIQTIKNVSDCVPLFLPHSLYLKPSARLNISVSLPPTVPGKTISNWDIMEKLRSIIQPDVFSILKVAKGTLEFIRFEAEIEDREKLRNILQRLDGRSLKLSSFSDNVKVRASEAKDDYPTRHDWDAFFRDTRDMDEMKPGERPDTMHISNLPIRWFCPRHMENEDNAKPSENIFKRIFEKFGEVRSVDIPICDPYRSQMKSHMSGMKTFNFDDELCFEGYVQFDQYISFVRAMDTFRGMKLIRKEGDRNLAVNMQITFDKSKHLSEMSIKRRSIVRERLISKENAKEEEEKKILQKEEEKLEQERRRQEELKEAELEKQRDREHQRKERQLRKLRDKEEYEINSKIRAEEKKLLAAQRKLESIRVLEVLFDRIKVKVQPDISKVKKESSKNRNKTEKKHKKEKTPEKFDLRNKLMKKFKSVQEQELEKQKDRLKKTKEGKSILTKILHDRSPSINSISSSDSILNDDSDKKKKKKRKKRHGSDSSSSSETDIEKSSKNQPKPMVMQPQPFPMQPMFNPETGEWMTVGMGMYPYPQFFPPTAMHGGFFPNPMVYRGFPRGGPRRFPRGRGRGYYRGGNHSSYENDSNYNYKDKSGGYDDKYDEHDYRYRSRSRSKSHSYSKSRYRRSRSRSRSKSRSRRSYSRSRSRSNSKSKKLASTLRRSNSKPHSRSKSSGGWSSSPRRRKGRSWSSHSKSRSRSRTRATSKAKHQIHIEPDELVKAAQRIQRSVERKLKIRNPVSDKISENKSKCRSKSRDKQELESHTPNHVDKEKASPTSPTQSIDSSKFVSPKRREKNKSSEKTWN